MRINVAQLLKEPVGQLRIYAIDEDSPEGSPLQGEVKLLRTDRGVLASGRLETTVTNTCSRCLEAFKSQLSLEIEEEYFPVTSVLSGAPLALPEDAAGAFVIGEDHILDLGEAVRQQTLLAQPMKPVCKHDCDGLCQSCGRNLNYGHCHCGELARPESPLSRLGGLLAAGGRKPKREGER
ncbi:DUF177 domain-containing protein [Chloroflexota bacterium]